MIFFTDYITQISMKSKWLIKLLLSYKQCNKLAALIAIFAFSMKFSQNYKKNVAFIFLIVLDNIILNDNKM